MVYVKREPKKYLMLLLSLLLHVSLLLLFFIKLDESSHKNPHQIIEEKQTLRNKKTKKFKPAIIQIKKKTSLPIGPKQKDHDTPELQNGLPRDLPFSPLPQPDPIDNASQDDTTPTPTPEKDEPGATLDNQTDSEKKNRSQQQTSPPPPPEKKQEELSPPSHGKKAEIKPPKPELNEQTADKAEHHTIQFETKSEETPHLSIRRIPKKADTHQRSSKRQITFDDLMRGFINTTRMYQDSSDISSEDGIGNTTVVDIASENLANLSFSNKLFKSFENQLQQEIITPAIAHEVALGTPVHITLILAASGRVENAIIRLSPRHRLIEKSLEERIKNYYLPPVPSHICGDSNFVEIPMPYFYVNSTYNSFPHR